MPTLLKNIAERSNSEAQANLAQKITKSMDLMRADGGLERTYNSTDEFVDEFKRYVRPDATYDNGNLALDIQKKQLEAVLASQKAIEEKLLPYLKAMGENIEDIRLLTREQNDIFNGRINRPRAISQSGKSGQ